MIRSISAVNLETKQVEILDTKEKFGPPLVAGQIIALTQDRVASVRTSSENQEIEIWDIVSGRKVSTLEGPDELPFTQNSVEVLAFSSDGRLLASGSMNSKVRLWQTDTGTQLYTLKKHITDSEERNDTTSLAFSPDDKLLACGNEDSTVQLWDITIGESLAVFTEHIGGVATVAFSPDSSTLATARSDGTVLLWDIIVNPIFNYTLL